MMKTGIVTLSGIGGTTISPESIVMYFQNDLSEADYSILINLYERKIESLKATEKQIALDTLRKMAKVFCTENATKITDADIEKIVKKNQSVAGSSIYDFLNDTLTNICNKPVLDSKFWLITGGIIAVGLAMVFMIPSKKRKRR